MDPTLQPKTQNLIIFSYLPILWVLDKIWQPLKGRYFFRLVGGRVGSRGKKEVEKEKKGREKLKMGSGRTRVGSRKS